MRGIVRDEHASVADVAVGVRCSTGTYIRSIARDLGAALDVGGHLVALRRTAVGPFGLEVARTLEDLAEGFEAVPLGEVARANFASHELDEPRAVDVQFGRKLELDLGRPGPVALFAPGGEFLALYEQDGAIARAVAVFTG